MLLAIILISAGCIVKRQSRFTSNHIIPGMTKYEVVNLYGKPYKISSALDNNHTLHESLYYKEIIYVGRWYEVNNILRFENSVLKSLEQGEEQLLYRDSPLIVK